MQIRKVTKRERFDALHLQLDFGDDLLIATNNKIRQTRSLTLPQQRTLVSAAPAFVAREGSSRLTECGNACRNQRLCQLRGCIRDDDQLEAVTQ